MPPDNGHWGLDKRVPLALLIAILIQTLGAVWWAASTTVRLNMLDRTTDLLTPLVTNIPIIADRQRSDETRLQMLEAAVRKLDIIEERQNSVIKKLDDNSKKLDSLVEKAR